MITEVEKDTKPEVTGTEEVKNTVDQEEVKKEQPNQVIAVVLYQLPSGMIGSLPYNVFTEEIKNKGYIPIDMSGAEAEQIALNIAETLKVAIDRKLMAREVAAEMIKMSAEMQKQNTRGPLS